MSLLVSADAKSMPLAVHVFGLGTRLDELRSALRRFDPAPAGAFELYSDGIDLPVFKSRCGDRGATPARPAGAQ